MNLSLVKNINELLKYANLDYRIYSDLDGVLVDFDKEFKKLGHGDPDSFTKKHGISAMWDIIIRETDHFWLNMDWTPDGKKLWDYIKKYNPILLTTPAYSVPHCVEDKQAWVKREIGDAEVIISTKKETYADEYSILIDDMKKNTMPWEEAGGIAILHKSADDTIT